jgi:glyoxalase family protein
MDAQLPGIHHVTAIASDPQRNIDFYTAILGLRLVKVTVNFDDPGTYHFYYGDENGSPGTILTFFPWPGARRGTIGTGQTAATAFSIPGGSMGYWLERLKGHNILMGSPTKRFDEEALVFFDPDGLALELVAHSGASTVPGWEAGPVPAEHAVRGFHSVTLWEARLESTAAVLEDILGFRRVALEGQRARYQAAGDGFAARVDIVEMPRGARAHGGSGTVHHVAWRTPDDEQQLEWKRRIAKAGLNVTPVQDRQYFHSIYFREPGGVLFEIATNPPGFALDEAPDQLGAGLKLPPWLEPQRRQIEQNLPEIRWPVVGEGDNV